MSSVRHASEEADESTPLVASRRNGNYDDPPTNPNDSTLHNHRPEEIPQVLCSSPSKPSSRPAISPYYPHVPILIGILCFVADLSGGLTNAAEVRCQDSCSTAGCPYTSHPPSIIIAPPLHNHRTLPYIYSASCCGASINHRIPPVAILIIIAPPLY